MPEAYTIEKTGTSHGHSSMYVMHKFFGRKQERVFRKYIEKYAQNEDDIVLDPFCGSGVTIGEALSLGKKAIGIDINPVSIFITRNTLLYISNKRLLEEFKVIEKDVKDEILHLYETICPKCGTTIPATCFTWQESDLYDRRYICPQDGKRVEKVEISDLELYKRISNQSIDDFFDSEGLLKYWFPNNSLFYSNGKAFLKKEKYEKISELFTNRNLISLAKLHDRIKQISDPDLKDSFLFAFSSMVHLASKMTPVRPSRPFSSSWIQPSYWYCPHFMESNVWELFERAVTGKQGLFKAKHGLKQRINDAIEVSSFEKLQNAISPSYLLLNDNINFIDTIPKNSVDYVITDPPYGHSIQYGELLYLWGAWLNLLEGYSEILDEEIVVNPRQNKNLQIYETLLTHAFQKIYTILKPEKYCTVTFHNPSLSIRNILYRSVIQSGFLFERVVYHPPARASAKSLLQPTGSQQGDYYFIFKKSVREEKRIYQSITNGELEEWIVEIVKNIFLVEGKPIPYNHLQNQLDPFLYKKLHDSNLLLTFNPKEVKN
ncbi:MAG: DNA methyltransferase, partial [Candidatus Hodarchaeales archaeon]